MVHTTNDVKFVPINEVVAVDNIYKSSAFLRATGNRTNVPANGILQHRWKPGRHTAVDEGGLKARNAGTFTTIEAYAHKIANKDTFSEELLESEEGLFSLIYNSATETIGGDIDGYISGAGTAVVDGLGDVQQLEVADSRDVVSAIATLSLSGRRPTALVMSTAAYTNLYSLNIGSVGVSPLAAITGDLENPGQVLGVQIFVFDGANPNDAFLGDFKNSAVGGIVTGYPKVKIETSALTIDGEVITLSDRNEVGIISEARFVFKVSSKARFARLVTEPVEDEGDLD